MKKLTSFLVAIAFMTFPFLISAQTRVVCVGNSVTAGYGLSDPSTQAWPARLAVMLGGKYSVFNCGVSGTTMLKKGSSPYWNTSRFNDARNYNPDILIISLGTNDAHPNNWQYKADFYTDYAAMIDAFRQNGRNPTIYVCFPVTCYGDASQIANLQNELIPIIAQISRGKGANLIDFNTPTQNQRNTLYNDNLHPNAAGALVVANTAFNTITPSVPAFYQNCSYGGYGIKLGVGDYTFSALSARGIFNDDISSLKIPSGYKAIVYLNDNFTGSSITLTANDDCLGDNGWDNAITSVKISPYGVTGRNGTYSLQNRNSGKYMDVAGGNPADGTNILQWTGTGGTNQQFRLTDVGDGAYQIMNVATGKAVDVAGGSTVNGANVLQWTYGGGNNQKFILIGTDNSYYKLKAVHSGRIVEVSGGGLAAGDDIIQFDDNQQVHGQWRLAVPGSLRTSANAEAAVNDSPNAITIYPNPTTSIVTLTHIPAFTPITVSDVYGHELLHSKSTMESGEVKADVSSLVPGIYFINIEGRINKILRLIKI